MDEDKNCNEVDILLNSINKDDIKTIINDEYDLLAEDIVDLLMEYEIKIRSSEVDFKLTINDIDILSYIFDDLLSKRKKSLLFRCGV
tara:strand:- start:521 stop:781 length:261 start_codon:yes stop_codon:yes gene_type:complete